jgi:flagellar assembly factor FliW
MRKVETTRFGEIQVKEEDIIFFPYSILGFPDSHNYVILEGPFPFYWLQSLDEPHVAFVIVEPERFFPDYEVTLKESDLKRFGMNDISEGKVWVIVTIPDNPVEMTANLLGPILINLKKNLGFQLVLDTDKYHTKHRLLRTDVRESKESKSC